MRNPISLTAAGLAGVLALGTATGAYAQLRLLSDGPQVEFRDMVARVVVTPEDRSDVDIRVRYGKAKVPQLMVSHRGNVTVLNGHLSGTHGLNFKINIDLNDSTPSSPRGTIFVSGLGQVDVNDLPLVFVRVPQNAVVKDSGYVFGQIGASNSLDFISSGNGSWNIGPVAGQLNIIDSGAAGIHAGPVSGDAIVDNMGSGDITLDGTRNLKISLSGSGNFTVQQAGDVDIQNQGSGDVSLGRIRSLKAGLNGSGDLNVQGVGGNFTLINNGSSDVNIDRLMGQVSLDMSGSGDVRIQQGQAQTFMIRGSGSGDVDFGGTAGTVNVDSNGSGDVSIGKATGAVQTRVTGSGEMHIGH